MMFALRASDVRLRRENNATAGGYTSSVTYGDTFPSRGRLTSLVLTSCVAVRKVTIRQPVLGGGRATRSVAMMFAYGK